MCTWRLESRLCVVLFRLPRRNAQKAPVLPTEPARDIDDLPHVITRVRQGAMQGLGHRQPLASDNDGPRKIGVRQVAQGVEDSGPAPLPMRVQLRTAGPARLELLLAPAPGLLPVTGKEVRKPRAQIPRHMPTNSRHGVPSSSPGHYELGLTQLAEGGLGERLVAQILRVKRSHDATHEVNLRAAA